MTQLSLFETAGIDQSAIRIDQSRCDDLLKLAELVRQGRDRIRKSLPATAPAACIGDLAQSVLRRHDLVAQRRLRTQHERFVNAYDSQTAG
ncbi:MAG: hypothetical protein AAF745_10395 [Planctomycetota bacterium]